MAIHSHPDQLTTRWQLPDGTEIVIRPIRPEDASIEQAFVRNLSPQSKYFRFMQALRELTPQMLVHFTHIDCDRDLALIAVATQHGKEVELAVGRYFTNPDGKSCEFAIVVADEWQGKGIGTRLLSQIIEHARSRGLELMEGDVLAENRHMLEFVRNLGFSVHPSPDNFAVFHVVKEL
jgi:acetyltransferase